MFSFSEVAVKLLVSIVSVNNKLLHNGLGGHLRQNLTPLGGPIFSEAQLALLSRSLFFSSPNRLYLRVYFPRFLSCTAVSVKYQSKNISSPHNVNKQGPSTQAKA